MDAQLNTKLELSVIDHFCTFEYLLSYIGRDWPSVSHSCYCPFHDNSQSPAAKFYKEEHNEHIFCFAEGIQYKPHHLLTKGIVPFSTSHVFSAIWNNLSDDEKNIFSEHLKYNTISINFDKQFDAYKKCKLNYFDLLSIIKNS